MSPETMLEAKTYTFFGGKVYVLESTDAGRHHVSISHRKRLPLWDEIKHVREKLCDPNKFYVMVLPPKEYYVNVMEYCFHLWEVTSKEDIEIWEGM